MAVTDLEKGGVGKVRSPQKDLHNMAWLVLMYLIQGVPLGLIFGAIPFLLQKRATYAQLALFAMSSYPYSLKLLWSPIVDCYYSDDIGRRKTWIVPIQIFVGVLMIFMSLFVDQMLDAPVLDVPKLTAIFFFIVVMMATQDIAVDGWALTMLSKTKLSYASTCQTIGLNAGFFLSFTIFLALNSAEFCNKFLRIVPQEKGVLSMSRYMVFWGWIYILVSILLVFFKHEKPFKKTHPQQLRVQVVYRQIWSIVSLPSMRTLIGGLLLCKLGYITTEIVGPLKLMELGFHKEDMALFALIQFPVMMFFSIVSGKLSRGNQPLTVWFTSLRLEILLSVLIMTAIYIFSRIQKQGAPVSLVLYGCFLVLFLAQTIANTMKFVSLGGFFMKISDKSIGGTYLTLLNTISNFGGTWPKSPILYLVDFFTRINCVETDNGDYLGRCKGMDATSKEECSKLGGSCCTERDGYYPIAITCLLFSVGFFYYLKTKVVPMQNLRETSWLVSGRRMSSD